MKLTFMPEAGLPPKKKPERQRLKKGLSVLLNGKVARAAVKEMKIEKKLEPVGSARGSLV